MRSKTLLVAGIGATMIALAGCSGHGIAGSAAPVGAVSGGTSGGGTAQGSSQGSSQKIATVGDLGALVQHNATGKNSAHVTMAMNVPGAGNVTMSGDLQFNGTQSAEQMSMTLPSIGAMQVVVVGTAIYMKLPASLAGMAGAGANTAGKPWVKIDIGGTDALSQSLGSTADLADQSDPTQLLKQISSAGTITGVTHETVDGVATTHYSINVDVKKMAANMGDSDVEKEALSQLTATTMPFDIWINSDNLPVRIMTKVAVADPTGGSGGSSEVQMTVDYTNWGENVSIAAPPADQVMSLGGN